ncbi:MAG: PEP-CTERM sorting domain-containing protein [Gemmataceae bacterium]
MIAQPDEGPNGPAFDGLDGDSKRGAYALYSVPAEGVVPEPSSVVLVAIALGCLAGRHWRRSTTDLASPRC